MEIEFHIKRRCVQAPQNTRFAQKRGQKLSKDYRSKDYQI